MRSEIPTRASDDAAPVELVQQHFVKTRHGQVLAVG